MQGDEHSAYSPQEYGTIPDAHQQLTQQVLERSKSSFNINTKHNLIGRLIYHNV